MKRVWENGHKGLNWAAGEMIDVSCDTRVHRRLSPRVTFCSLQSCVWSRGAVAAFTALAALTPLINSKRKPTRWTITSLFCWIALSSRKPLVIDTDVRKHKAGSSSFWHFQSSHLEPSTFWKHFFILCYWLSQIRHLHDSAVSERSWSYCRCEYPGDIGVKSWHLSCHLSGILSRSDRSQQLAPNPLWTQVEWMSFGLQTTCQRHLYFTKIEHRLKKTWERWARYPFRLMTSLYKAVPKRRW